MCINLQIYQCKCISWIVRITDMCPNGMLLMMITWWGVCIGICTCSICRHSEAFYGLYIIYIFLIRRTGYSCTFHKQRILVGTSGQQESKVNVGIRVTIRHLYREKDRRHRYTDYDTELDMTEKNAIQYLVPRVLYAHNCID